MVSYEGTIRTFCWLIEFDGEILDRSSAELLVHPLPHIPRGLPDFQKARVGGIVNRLGIDARASRWFWF